MARKGWAESNGGNISLRLKEEYYDYFNEHKPISDWIKLPVTMPEIGGDRFLVTGTGRYLRNIELFPEKNVGVIEVNKKGRLTGCFGVQTNRSTNFELPSHFITLPD